MLHGVKNGKWISGKPLFGKTWVDFVVGKKAFNLGISGRKMPKASWEVWAATQVSSPVRFMTTQDGRFYWWFENAFYWESDGLSPADVVALVRDKQRRKQRQLERARESLTVAASSNRPRRAIPREMRLAVFNRDGAVRRM